MNIIPWILLKAKYELRVECQWEVTISWLLCDLSHRYSLLPVVWKAAVRNIMWLNENYNVITVNDADLAKVKGFVRKCFMCICLGCVHDTFKVFNQSPWKTSGNKCSKAIHIFSFFVTFWRRLCFCGCFELCLTICGWVWTWPSQIWRKDFR